MTFQHENPPENSEHTRTAARREVRRRDWAVVAVVAVIVIGLGVYLLVRPATTGRDQTSTTGQ